MRWYQFTADAGLGFAKAGGQPHPTDGSRGFQMVIVSPVGCLVVMAAGRNSREGMVVYEQRAGVRRKRPKLVGPAVGHSVAHTHRHT